MKNKGVSSGTEVAAMDSTPVPQAPPGLTNSSSVTVTMMSHGAILEQGIGLMDVVPRSRSVNPSPSPTPYASCDEQEGGLTSKPSTSGGLTSKPPTRRTTNASSVPPLEFDMTLDDQMQIEQMNTDVARINRRRKATDGQNVPITETSPTKPVLRTTINKLRSELAQRDDEMREYKADFRTAADNIEHNFQRKGREFVEQAEDQQQAAVAQGEAKVAQSWQAQLAGAENTVRLQNEKIEVAGRVNQDLRTNGQRSLDQLHGKLDNVRTQGQLELDQMLAQREETRRQLAQRDEQIARMQKVGDAYDCTTKAEVEVVLLNKNEQMKTHEEMCAASFNSWKADAEQVMHGQLEIKEDQVNTMRREVAAMVAEINNVKAMQSQANGQAMQHQETQKMILANQVQVLPYSSK